MSNQIKTFGSKFFPNISHLASVYRRNNLNKPVYINFHKDFKNTGYVRKIHTIQRKKCITGDTFHIGSSTFFIKDERTHIPCYDKDILVLSDYFTDSYMTFHNKLILIECDFSLPKKYKILCIKEAPYNTTHISQLESQLARTLEHHPNINIV